MAWTNASLETSWMSPCVAAALLLRGGIKSSCSVPSRKKKTRSSDSLTLERMPRIISSSSQVEVCPSANLQPVQRQLFAVQQRGTSSFASDGASVYMRTGDGSYQPLQAMEPHAGEKGASVSLLSVSEPLDEALSLVACAVGPLIRVFSVSGQPAEGKVELLSQDNAKVLALAWHSTMRNVLASSSEVINLRLPLCVDKCSFNWLPSDVRFCQLCRNRARAGRLHNYSVERSSLGGEFLLGEPILGPLVAL